MAGGSTPTKLGWRSGKPSRDPPVAGLAHTGSRCFSARAMAACQPPAASMSGPATITGDSAPARRSARSASAASSGAVRPITRRAMAAALRSASASAFQSSIGIETNAGPLGGSMAWWMARAIAPGTSWARGGSWLHFT